MKKYQRNKKVKDAGKEKYLLSIGYSFIDVAEIMDISYLVDRFKVNFVTNFEGTQKIYNG